MLLCLSYKQTVHSSIPRVAYPLTCYSDKKKHVTIKMFLCYSVLPASSLFTRQFSEPFTPQFVTD